MVKRQIKHNIGAKNAAKSEIALTNDQRSTVPIFDTSQSTDTEQGTNAPKTKTTVESVRIQFKNKAENRDESNMSGGNANSPA
jgi:hypothetical protein